MQLEGLYALLKKQAREYNVIQKAAAEILRTKEDEDNYDATYLLLDNMWNLDHETIADIFKGEIKILSDSKNKGKKKGVIKK